MLITHSAISGEVDWIVSFGGFYLLQIFKASNLYFANLILFLWIWIVSKNDEK